MFLKHNAHLRRLERIRIPETRDLVAGLRLDRNEKVANWPKDFLSRVFADKPDAFLSIYPDSEAVYRKLADYLGVGESQLLLTSGIDGAMKTLYELVTRPGDTVAVLSPTYAMYKVYADLFQVDLLQIGYRQDLTLDRSQIDACLDNDPAMLFIPNPNQPIESALDLDDLAILAERALAHDCLLVIDEAYHLFGCDSAIPLVERFPNVVVLRTFSKAFGLPAIRTGFMVSSEDNMDILGKTRFAHEGNALSYAVVEYVLDHINLVDEYIESIAKGRDFVRRALGSIGFSTYGDKGNFFLIDLHTPDQAADTVALLKDRKIYVKGPWPAPFDQYISITLGPTHLMQRFIDAMHLAQQRFYARPTPTPIETMGFDPVHRRDNTPRQKETRL